MQSLCDNPCNFHGGRQCSSGLCRLSCPPSASDANIIRQKIKQEFRCNRIQSRNSLNFISRTRRKTTKLWIQAHGPLGLGQLLFLLCVILLGTFEQTLSTPEANGKLNFSSLKVDQLDPDFIIRFFSRWLVLACGGCKFKYFCLF